MKYIVSLNIDKNYLEVIYDDPDNTNVVVFESNNKETIKEVENILNLYQKDKLNDDEAEDEIKRICYNFDPDNIEEKLIDILDDLYPNKEDVRIEYDDDEGYIAFKTGGKWYKCTICTIEDRSVFNDAGRYNVYISDPKDFDRETCISRLEDWDEFFED